MRSATSVSIGPMATSAAALSIGAAIVAGIATGAPTELLIVLMLLNTSNWLFMLWGFATENPFLKLYAFVFLVWYAIRVTTLVLVPGTHAFVGWSWWVLDSFTQDDLTRTAFVLLLYHLVTGLIIGLSWLRLRQHVTTVADDVSRANWLVRRLFALFSILAAYRIVYDLILMAGRDTWAVGGVLGYLGLALSSDVVTMLLWIAALVIGRKLDRTSRWCILGFLALYAVSSLANGSRGFFVKFLVVAAVYALTRSAEYRLTLHRSNMVAAGAMIVVTLATIYVGMAYRPLYRNPEADLSAAAVLRAVTERSRTAPEIVTWASWRMSRFDIFSMMVLKDRERTNRSITLENTARVFLNWMVPGDLFTDRDRPLWPSHRSVPVDYAGGDTRTLNPTHSDELALFGAAVSTTGVYAGLIIAAVVALLAVVVATRCIRLVPAGFSTIGSVFFYWLFVTLLLLPGLDMFLFVCLQFVLQFVVFAIFARAIDLLSLRHGRQTPMMAPS